MKIFVICQKYGTPDNNPALSTLSINKEVEVVPFYTLPDTALTRPGRPFFVPDYASPCTLQLHVVVRIGRLGKGIPERFAHRYVDGVTLGVVFSAANLLKTCRENGWPWEVATGFDGAACLGEMLPPENATAQSAEFRLEVNGNAVQCGRLENLPRPIPRLIADLSRFYTLRQGDLIYTGCAGGPLQAEINSQLTGWLNSQEVMSFKVK